VEIDLPTFLTSALDGSEWSVPRPGHFTPGGRVPSNHSIGGWLGTRAGLVVVAKTKIHCPCWE